MRPPHNLGIKLIICLLLLVVTLAAFWQVKDLQFVNMDDPNYVTDNFRIQAGLTLGNVVWAFSTHNQALLWHPLTWISHMADCQFFGTSPRGPHLVNLGLHLVNTLLLFLMLSRLTGALWPSALVAALFALHPLHVESVAWVAERKDVLSTGCWLLALGAYGYYAARPGLARYLAVVAFYVAALFSKPMTVTLPFVLLLLDFWPLGRLSFPPAAGKQPSASRVALSRLLLEKLPLVLLAIPVGVMTVMAQQRAVATSTFLPLWARLANALVSYVKYLGKMIWPYPLAAFYPHPLLDIPWWQPVGAALLLAGVSYLALREGRRRPYLAMGWLWYLITLLPVIGLVQAGRQALADRFTYVPLIGIFIMVAWAAGELAASGRHRRVLVPLGAVLVLLAYLPLTWLQVGYWRDSRELFTHTLQVTRNNYFAYLHLGNDLANQGDPDGAAAMYRKALEINPNYQEAYNNLGNAYAKKGNLEEAIEMYRLVLEIDPRHQEAYNNLGAAYLQTGQVDLAMEMLQQAIQINPHYAKAYYNLGNAYVLKGDMAEAIRMYQKALEISPAYAKAQNSLKKLHDLGYF